jgi:hypothetical protein
VRLHLKQRGALPTFFIIGAPKTGSTSFHYYLEQHPQIQMSNVKEPGFFAPASNPRDLRRSINRLDQYERLFDPTAAVRGEASTVYSEYPFRQRVPERIKELVPEARFIYLVRDPVARTVSHYHHHVASEGELRSPEETLGDLEDPHSPCIWASMYMLQLELFLRVFPQERILVVDQAELFTNRRPTLQKVFRFLSVDEEFDSPRFDVEFLKSVERRTYPPGFANFVGRTLRPSVRWLPPGTRRSLRVAMERMLLPPLELAELDDDLLLRLTAFYGKEVERLRELTGQTFASWSTYP